MNILKKMGENHCIISRKTVFTYILQYYETPFRFNWFIFRWNCCNLSIGGDWNIMKLNKWITLGALFGCAVAGFAQTKTQDVRTLDIVIRDFQPNHPDFENFSEESVSHLDEIYNYVTNTGAAMNLYGYDVNWYTNAAVYHNSCGNGNTIGSGHGARIGTDGLPMTPNDVLYDYLQTISTSKDVLKYGECSQKSAQGWTQRGYENSQDGVSGFKCPQGKTEWSNEVIYTPGMVFPFLSFPGLEDSIVQGKKFDMLKGVVITKRKESCDNQYFEQWYADVPGVNKRINTTMDIPKDPNSKYYIYDYNYNNGGYSPLDSIDPYTRKWVMNKPCNPKIQEGAEVCDQYLPQTLSIFCPPYGYAYAKNQADFMGKNTAKLCEDWLNQGGPRAVNSDGLGNSAAYVAAAMNGDLGLQHLRNYAFTMMGYASFKYKYSNQFNAAGQLDPEVFEFAGDDDMWIFVDGVLVVDLGGTHLATPGKVNIQTLALKNHGCHVGEPLAGYDNCVGASDATGWADDTWHHLHFFYADRQSDGSNIYIRTSLAELAPSRFGQPSISEVVVKVNEEGEANNSMYMNVPLADSSVAKIVNPNVPSMVVLREVTVNGVKQTVVYGFYVESLEGPIDKGASGQMYQFKGVVKDGAGNVVDGGLLGGDRLAFNVPWSQGLQDDGNGHNYTDQEWTQLMAWSKLVNFHVASNNGKQVEGFDERDKWGKISYTAVAKVEVVADDPAYDRPDFSEQAQKLTDLAGSGTLPTDMTADLVLTPIPAIPNVDPLKYAKDSAETMMKSGVLNNTVVGNGVVYGAGQSTNSTLCYNDGKDKAHGGKSNESCTQWSFPTTQPFHVNIRVFDHLGHFVNQYSKRLTGDDFKSALAGQRSGSAPVGVPTSGCDTLPLYGPTGAMLATIKMYPVTEKGRLLATGPYIYQMTVVKEAFTYCYESSGNSPTIMSMPFQRTTETIRRGYRRTLSAQQGN